MERANVPGMATLKRLLAWTELLFLAPPLSPGELLRRVILLLWTEKKHIGFAFNTRITKCPFVGMDFMLLTDLRTMTQLCSAGAIRRRSRHQPPPPPPIQVAEILGLPLEITRWLSVRSQRNYLAAGWWSATQMLTIFAMNCVAREKIRPGTRDVW